ncbi:MAG: hypothetical protein GY820_05460 [Gammaproteobacteria bacterium]|nr:hypothetical protein [Gammaproteobacteria bacterium]
MERCCSSYYLESAVADVEKVRAGVGRLTVAEGGRGTEEEEGRRRQEQEEEIRSTRGASQEGEKSCCPC